LEGRKAQHNADIIFLPHEKLHAGMIAILSICHAKKMNLMRCRWFLRWRWFLKWALCPATYHTLC